MQVEQFIIPICPGVKLLVYSLGAPLYVDDYAADFGESRWQLLEGKEYEYELVDDSLNEPADWSLEGPASMVQKNPRHKNRGVITTGIYVGTAHFKALKSGANEGVPVDFEVLSIKC